DVIWSGGRLCVAGPATRAELVARTAGAIVVGARFRPGVGATLLGLPACELRDQRPDLDQLWGRAAVEPLAEALSAARGGAAQLQVMTRALVQRLPQAAAPDPLVLAVVRELQRDQRPPGVASLAARLGVSPRQLHRRCLQAVGYGPKTLERILRLQRSLALAPRTLGLGDLAAAAGYADQAHLTHEYVRLTGLTPARFLAEWAGRDWPGASPHPSLAPGAGEAQGHLVAPHRPGRERRQPAEVARPPLLELGTALPPQGAKTTSTDLASR
ncbi:MAG TPA: helix-turn-helix domain-containing protein, partial [Chloroflexota bacterium]|nr:helix-turn-helix domain-containing protein [Chloroflexota bacterium]